MNKPPVTSFDYEYLKKLDDDAKKIKKSMYDSEYYTAYPHFTNEERNIIHLRHIYHVLNGLHFDYTDGNADYKHDVRYWLYHISYLVDEALVALGMKEGVDNDR